MGFPPVVAKLKRPLIQTQGLMCNHLSSFIHSLIQGNHVCFQQPAFLWRHYIIHGGAELASLWLQGTHLQENRGMREKKVKRK